MNIPYNAMTRDPYGGKNIGRLLDACQENGWTIPAFVTYLQAQQLGGQVKKGSHGVRIRTRSASRTVEDDNDDEKTETFPGKPKTVFHVSQAGLTADGRPVTEQPALTLVA